MHLLKIISIYILMYGFAVGITIISKSNIGNSIETADKTMDNFGSVVKKSQIHVDENDMVGKSHRFYFTDGVRTDDDTLLENRFKQIGWKRRTDGQANVTLTAPTNKTLTYVMLIVYQESDKNRIKVVDGGINKENIVISINADQTRFIAYNVSFYGHTPNKSHYDQY